MTKLLLTDKDGTLITPKSGNKFVHRPWDQVPIQGVEAKLNQYHFDNWKIAVVSNQGGVDKGYKTLESTIFEMQYLLELFPQVEECYFCPDFQGEECYRVWREDLIRYDSEHWTVRVELAIIRQFRKPNPGMLKLAMHFHDIDEVLYVGDRSEDEQAAIAVGVPFMWASDWLIK